METQERPHPQTAKGPQPPTRLSQKLVRYILGFSVGIAVGLAPYLGRLNIPLFTPLLSLIPDSLHETILPFSSALMGIVAIVTQWYGNEHNSRKWIRKMFARTLILAIASFVILVFVHTFVVVRVPIRGGNDSITFLVGFVRPQNADCPPQLSDSDCIKKISFDPSAIDSLWGDKQIRIAKLALTFPYLIFTSTFGMTIGLLLLRDQAITKTRGPTAMNTSEEVLKGKSDETTNSPSD